MGVLPAAVTIRYRNVSVVTSLEVGDQGLPTLTHTLTSKMQVGAALHRPSCPSEC